MKVLVTGGAGFIGSAVVRQYIAETDAIVVNVDSLTYAGNMESLGTAGCDPRHIFVKLDIRDRPGVERLFFEHRPDAVMHLAAESHVDRSIHQSAVFVETNINGTHNLLEAARTYWESLEGLARSKFRFHHISTDEVYGDLGPEDPPFTEDTPYRPSSPYAASKAGSDHLVRAWHRTYGVPTVITNCSNNYGPYQFPEKLIPLMILNAIDGKHLPVYGKGDNVRDWLFVEDHARGLRRVLEAGRPGRTYNIGGGAERTNLDVVNSICAYLDEMDPRPVGPRTQLIQFVSDRPGHDRRYAIDDSRVRDELGWRPLEDFEQGLKKTIRWYLDNTEWIDRVRSGEYSKWLESNYSDRNVTR